MSNSSNTNGRAFEYICITTLKNVISKFRTVEIEESSTLSLCKNEWEKLSAPEKNIFQLGAIAAVNQILILEPRIEDKQADDVLKLAMQKDLSGVNGDVRDILIIRESIKWEIGLSLKHNNFAVKHSRIAKQLDFGDSWFGEKCSAQYWDEVAPVFEYLSEKKREGLNFSQLANKSKILYVPTLEAFKKELFRLLTLRKNNPAKLVEYLMGRFDFYKVVSVDSQNYTQIQAMNLHKTLNLPSPAKESLYKIPKVKLPSRVIHLDFVPGSETTLELYLDEGWHFTFRLHNAKKEIEESLKFDIKLIGMPSSVITINCKWV